MSLKKILRYAFGVFVALLVVTLTATQVNAQASCPPRNCTYGKDVGRDYFSQVVGRLSNVPASDFAVDALMAWKPYENTRACWNPLATTWKMTDVCNFNSVGVQNYQDQATGVRATANTLNLGYYDAIRKMLRMEAFDREGMRSALGTWGTCRGASCDALLDQWQALWNRYKGSGSSGGPSGYTRCADEGQRCNFSGTKDVAYGANGRWAYRNGVTGGADCNNSVFGDPIVGVQKACYIKDTAGSGGGSNCDGGEGVYLYEHSNYQGRCTKLTGDASQPRDWFVGNDAVSSVRMIGSWTATLYEHDNYQGTSSRFTGSDTDLGNDAIGHDRTSSARIARGSSGGGSSGGPSGYAYCATEGQRCNFSGAKDVAYGANGRFAYRTSVTGGIDCNNGVFGDPISGVQKACYIKDAAGGGTSGGNCDGGEGVYLYEHTNYQGRCTKLTGDAANPRSWSVGNDAVSSLRMVGNWTATLYEHDDYQGASSRFTGSDPDLRDDAIGNDRASSIRLARR